MKIYLVRMSLAKLSGMYWIELNWKEGIRLNVESRQDVFGTEQRIIHFCGFLAFMKDRIRPFIQTWHGIFMCYYLKRCMQAKLVIVRPESGHHERVCTRVNCIQKRLLISSRVFDYIAAYVLYSFISLLCLLSEKCKREYEGVCIWMHLNRMETNW